MSDTLDLLTLDEGKNAIHKPLTETDLDTQIAQAITAVSRRLDQACGPIVIRTITNELHQATGNVIFLRYAPASRTSATTITTVTEYSGGTGTALTAEGLTVSTGYDYRFDQTTGALYRRSSWAAIDYAAGAQVQVTYQAGRYANTAAVDPLFKEAAAIMLQQVWRPNHGAGTVTLGGGTFETTIPITVPREVEKLLMYELQAPAVA